MSKSQFVVHQDMNLFGASIKAGTYVRQKEWAGLTDEEIAEGAKQSWVDKQAFESAVWWAEERLKEKNRG